MAEKAAKPGLVPQLSRLVSAPETRAEKRCGSRLRSCSTNTLCPFHSFLKFMGQFLPIFAVSGNQIELF